jgi:hypothetical protein
MANIYVKLKDEYCKQKNAMAIDVYGQLIYPGNNRWVVYEDKWLELIKNHRDYENLDIKTQDVINEEKKNYQEEIEDVANGNWKKSEKIINQTSDKQKLNDIRKIAIANDRKIIIKLIDARLEEISF